MPRHDWIHKYPRVQALLQQPEEALEYAPSDDTPVNGPYATFPASLSSSTDARGIRWCWEVLSLGNGGVSVRIWRARSCLYAALGPRALLGIPGGLVRFDPTCGIIERAVVSRSGRRRLKRWRMPRRAVKALMAEIDTIREGEA